jgi:glycerol 3-phosphatase-2
VPAEPADPTLPVPAHAGRGGRLLAPSAPVLLDLDGVVWLSGTPIPGAVEAIARLRRHGHRVVFVTNNSAPLVSEHEAALDAIGVPAAGDVITSSMAAATLLDPPGRVMVAGDRGLVEAAIARGAQVVVDGDPDGDRVDAVLVGFHRHFDYEGLRRAATAVRRGAVLVAANDDATYPTPDGPIPGGGSILAAVETAAGRRAAIAGKPYPPMVSLVRELLGGAADDAVMVGDRPDTDGRFAATLGVPFVLVHSGVTGAHDPVDPAPDLAVADLAAAVDHLLPAAGEQG